ncbi:FAD dependent oxidoreductase [Exidia glandulosa HHB12029]|uniref:FAD dependent oxidoreductase n=1 Tax=Exidia glandulosa HHB12029 TaxID=1314781 RepID=A0A166AA60_EXIGL|nr:FAD dependent oxidoreductase [Exidia glandulosa HHB12029]
MVLPVPLNVHGDFERFFASFEPAGQRRQTSLPVPNPTKSFWIDSSPDANPLAAEGSTGALTADADIAIIGSGITGVAAAYNLAKGLQGQRVKIVLLDARDFCASGRNGGHLTSHGFFNFSSNVTSRRGLVESALEQHTIDSVAGVVGAQGWAKDIDLVDSGRLCLFFSSEEEADARRRFDSARAAGVDMSGVQWLSRSEMNKTHGVDYPAVRIPGRNVWPLKLVTKLFTLAKSSFSADVKLHTRTPVTSITRAGSGWDLRTPRGTLRATYVLHATNGYAAHLLPHLTGPQGIIPVRGHIIATRASGPLSGKESYIGNDGFEYWFPRPTSSSRDAPLVILGGGREVAPNYDIYVTDDAHFDAKVGGVLRKFLPSVCPRSFERARQPEMEWTGIMGFTKTGEPFVGPVIDHRGSKSEFTGQYICAGYTGHGMTRAYACAEAVAQIIIADMRKQQWNCPEWLPSEYLTWNKA